MKRLQYLLLLILCIIAHSTFAQVVQGHFVSYHLNIDDGLPSNSITAITQDDDGFIWIGTAAGLCRYDGYNLLTLQSMSPDSKANVDKHVAYMDYNNRKHQLHVVTVDRSESVYDTGKSRFISYTKHTYKRTYPFDAFKMSFQGKPFTAVSSRGIIGDYKYVADNDGNLYLFPPKGEPIKLHLIDNARVQTFRNDKIRMAIDKNDNLYIATYGAGLYIYNYENKHLQHFTANDKHALFNSNYLTAVAVDHVGNIWIGTDDAGVSCLSTLHFLDAHYIYPLHQLSGNQQVRAMFAKGEELIFGTTLGELYSYHLKKRSMSFLGNYPSTIYSYLEDSAHRQWVGTRGGGVFVNGQQYSKKDTKYHLQSNLIYGIAEDVHGRIWLGSFDEGLLVTENPSEITPPYQFKQYLRGNSVIDGIVLTLFVDPKGILWIATKQGIFSVDTHEEHITEQSFRQYSMANHQLPGDEILTLIMAKDGTLWAGINGHGAIHLKEEKGKLRILQQYNPSHGFNVHNVYSLTEDRYGNIWAGTEHGMTVINTESKIINNYLLAPTFMGNAFTDNSAAWSESGILTFGTRDGILVIHNVDKPFPATSSRLVFTDLLLNGQSIHNLPAEEAVTTVSLAQTTSLKLKHYQNSLTICFSDLDYAYSPTHLYQYYMEGYDRGWHPTTNRHMAEYNNLKPGRYVFHVRQQMTGGENLYDEQILEIIIHQPWYNTWWAWLLYILTVTAVGTYFYKSMHERSVLNRKIKMEKELTEFKLNFFTHVTHELRTPLSIILSAVEKMKDYKGKPIPKATLTAAVRGTNRLSKLVSQLMEFRRLRTGSTRLQVSRGNLIKLLQDIYQDLWTMGNQKDINMSFTPFAQSYEMLFDAKAVETVVYNLLSNALKYTPRGGRVSLEVKHINDEIKICIADTGSGLTEEQLLHLREPFMKGYVSQGGIGVGLYMAYSMAELHHGHIDYQHIAEGSLFVATLPTRDDIYSVDEYAESNAFQSLGMEENNQETAIIHELLPNAINQYTIAIVEDDPDMMEQIKNELGIYFKICTYMDGKSAVEGIIKEPPSLIICDVMLPEINGYEVIKQIKAQYSYLPAIMLTALDDENHQVKSYEVGADDYMVKPCNYRVLVARMIQLIKWNLQNQINEQKERQRGNNTSLSEQKIVTDSPVLLSSIQDKKFLNNLNTLISNHLADSEFSMDDLANSLHLGRSTFYGRVKELTGLSPNKYFLKCRMEEAARLLMEGDLTVSECSYRVGIQESSYFYRCFKSYFGVSPSTYKKVGSTQKE